VTRLGLGIGLGALGAAPAAALLVARGPLGAAALWFALTSRRVWTPR